MATDLYALAEQVEDEAGYLRFLAALAADWEEDRRLAAANPPKPFGPSPLGWENGSIGGFLDAAATWGEDSRDGLPGYSRPENTPGRAAAPTAPGARGWRSRSGWSGRNRRVAARAGGSLRRDAVSAPAAGCPASPSGSRAGRAPGRT